MLISVIIPVYNIENYISKCIESVLKQTYKNIEIILVNDGSTDKSGDICDCFATQDCRIQAIHKQNGGQISARKAGVGCAKGEYILFVDGDDWIEQDMIENLVRLILGYSVDIVTSGFVIERDGMRVRRTDSLPEGVYASDSDKEFLYSHMILNGSVDKTGILGSACMKLYRTTLLKEVINTLSDGMNYGEDSAVCWSCCIKADSILITHEIYYHYVKRAGSSSESTDIRFLYSFNDWLLCMRKNAEKSKYYSLLRKQIEVYFVKCLLNGIVRFMEIEKGNTLPSYLFDDSIFPENARIVLYGAGIVGQSFYEQLVARSSLKLVAWVDRDYQKYQAMQIKIDGIDALVNLDYDYIVLGVKKESTADEIRAQLIEVGVDSKKIVWTVPETIIEKYIKL